MASAQESGNMRLNFTSQQESSPVLVFDVSTKMISGGAVTYPTGETLKAQPTFADLGASQAFCSGRIVMEFVADAADTIESEESGCHIPVEVFEVAGGRIGRKVGTKMLTFENATGSLFDSAGTTDIVCGASAPVRIDYWDVPRGLAYRFALNSKPHVYFGDDTA